jgi:hypothetical protein
MWLLLAGPVAVFIGLLTLDEGEAA